VKIREPGVCDRVLRSSTPQVYPIQRISVVACWSHSGHCLRAHGFLQRFYTKQWLGLRMEADRFVDAQTAYVVHMSAEREGFLNLNASGVALRMESSEHVATVRYPPMKK